MSNTAFIVASLVTAAAFVVLEVAVARIARSSPEWVRDDFRRAAYWLHAALLGSAFSRLGDAFAVYFDTDIIAGLAAVRVVVAIISVLAALNLLRLTPIVRRIVSLTDLQEQMRQKDRAYRELDAMRASLEKRVEERTRELNNANLRILRYNAELQKAVDAVARLLADLAGDPSFKTLLDVERNLRQIAADKGIEFNGANSSNRNPQ